MAKYEEYLFEQEWKMEHHLIDKDLGNLKAWRQLTLERYTAAGGSERVVMDDINGARFEIDLDMHGIEARSPNGPNRQMAEPANKGEAVEVAIKAAFDRAFFNHEIDPAECKGFFDLYNALNRIYSESWADRYQFFDEKESAELIGDAAKIAPDVRLPDRRQR